MHGQLRSCCFTACPPRTLAAASQSEQGSGMASTAHLRGTDDVIKDTSVAAAGAAVCQSTIADLIRHSPMKGS